LQPSKSRDTNPVFTFLSLKDGPIVNGGAEDADTCTQDGAKDGPVLGLLRLGALLLVRVAHGVGEQAEALPLSLLVELILFHQMALLLAETSMYRKIMFFVQSSILETPVTT
jgi:hypothetical protein